MKQKRNLLEDGVHGIFLLLGLVTVGCVLLITVYLVISGIPAIRQIGLVRFWRFFRRLSRSRCSKPGFVWIRYRNWWFCSTSCKLLWNLRT